MRLFVNINGIDLYYSDIIFNKGVENVDVKALAYNTHTHSYKTAIFQLPSITLKENNGFDDITINYVKRILEETKTQIFDSARNHTGRSITENNFIKVGDKRILIK